MVPGRSFGVRDEFELNEWRQGCKGLHTCKISHGWHMLLFFPPEEATNMLSRPKLFAHVNALTALLLCGTSLLAGGPPAQKAPPPYLNPSLPISQRVDDLVSRMTLQEKVLQMQHTAPAIPRLGVPSYDWWNEALHGVARAGYATVFPRR
jgi:hypothetical protein